MPPGPKPPYLDPETLARIGPLELAAREVVEGMRVGMHKSPLRGFSTEFALHRQYVPGDSYRDIDWRVYARSGRYYVKLYEAETNFTAHLLLDASRSMHYGSGEISKLEYAKHMAASLAYMIVEQRDSVGLGVFDSELRSQVAPKSSRSVINTITQELEKVKGEPKTDVGGMLSKFAQQLKRRSLIILFSDLFDDVDGFVKGLNHLRFRGHDVTVFHTLDPAELEFPFDGSTKFVGLENEGDIVTQPKRVRAAYLEALNEFMDTVRTACDRTHIDYRLVNTSVPVGDVLAPYLYARMHGASAGGTF
jgi:uncharacterized protein (DUF58 family)